MQTVESADGSIMGYVMGKPEVKDEVRNGHVSAITVAPAYRRLGVARRLMGDFERVSLLRHGASFVDLFVRPSNTQAVSTYGRMGYDAHQTVPKYYSATDETSGEDALGKAAHLTVCRNEKIFLK